MEGGFRGMNKEVKKIWFSDLRGHEDVILLQGRHSFNPR